MGQKESDLMFFPGPGYTIEYHVVNIDMDEWGASASLVAGYNFPIKNSSSAASQNKTGKNKDNHHKNR